MNLQTCQFCPYKTGQSVRNDNTVVINNFCFQYVKLVNIIHRMSYKLKWFKNTLDDI